MKQEKMIDIILEEEKNLWYELKSYIEMFGYDDKVTKAARNQWFAIDRLIQKLEIHDKRR